MTTTSTTTLRVDFVSESAAYENTFGWYNKVTGMGGILFADVEQEGRNAPLVAGQSYATFTVNTADVANIQFFLIPNGYHINKEDPGDLTGAIKVIQLSDGSWAVADVDANGNVITKNGKPDILNGAGANALFTETSKNAGGTDYASSVVGSNQTAATLAGDTADGATGLIAWEDLAATRNKNGSYGKPGDADYNDAVFRVSIVGGAPVANADAVSVSEDAGATTINVLANDSDPDAGDTLHVAAINVAGVLGTVAIAPGGGSIVYTPAASFQSLGAGQTATETFSYTVADQAGHTTSANVTVTIVGANDGPVAVNDTNAADPVTESGVNPGNTPFPGDATATGNVLTNDTDVDAGDTKTVTTTGSFNGTYGTLTLNANGSYTYTLNNADADTNALAQGEAAADVFSYTMRDTAGATSSATLTINVTGTNDKPVITGGATTGSVQEDTVTQATGQLLATDPDHGATKAWTVVGGTQSVAASYHFAADSFTITRNGVSVLQDDFSDGAPPPNSPPFGNGTATTYTGFGGFTESGGKVFLDSGIAQNPFNANPQDPVIGQNALARTNIDPANLSAGLKTNAPFTVEGVFDLILPDSPRESYGIRVIDRLINNPPQPTDQLGNDTIELVVRMNLAGVVTVALRRIDFTTNTVTQIESIPLNTALDADQIHLKFDHVAGAQTISASFDYMQGGAVIASQAFASTPEIFHGENWTRGDFVASAPLMTDSILDGSYGTLNVNQSGTWNYLLNNGKAETQALAQGEHQTETFQVQVTDQFGANDTRNVTIDVVGTNDAPIVSAPVAGGGAEGSGTATVNLLHGASDVDHGAVLHIANVIWDEEPTPNSMPAGFMVVGNSIQVDTNALAYNQMAQGETFVTHFTYNIVDEFGASVVQHATVTVTGTNDAPTVSAAVTGGGNEGLGGASVDLLQFASDVDHNAVLHVSNVIWDDAPVGTPAGGLPAGFTLVGDSIQIDTNAPAYDALAQGETFTTHFTYDVVDEHGASVQQHAEVTVTGTNDAPTVSAAVSGGGNEGSGTAVVDLLQGASDVDHGAVLHIENVVWDEVPGDMPAGMPAGFAVVGNSIEIDTNSLAYNAMAEGETFATHFTYNVVDEHGAITVQHATVTITGTNDAPTVSASVAGGGNEGSGGASVDLLQSASDVDNGAVLHVENVSWDEGSGPDSLPAGFTLVGNSLQIDTNSGAYDALAQGETFTTHFTYNVVDEHGASTVQHAEVTITGTNDAPVISGTATGSIQEDTGPAFVSGTLTAADPDDGATKTWSVVGGTTAHTADYHTMIDEFRVTKNGGAYFDDTFSDGVPPSPTFITGAPDPSVFYSIRAGNLVSEADGYAVLDGSSALPPAFGATGAGHLVKLFTNFDDNNTTLGLKKGDSFTVEGRFDLVPLDMGDNYGIRLDDRVLPTGPSAPPQHPGDDGIQLMVTRSTLTGNVIVRLGEVDYNALTNTTLATTLLNAAPGDDQIVLKLTHNASSPGVLTATYQLYDDGVATGSGSVSSAAARIFGTETPSDPSDDENWTQAAFESGDSLTNTQAQNGAYGSLSINQNGTWTYNVANTHANVQALAQGEIVHDTFQVQVADQFGAFDTETVDVTVTGTNDAPVIAEGVTAGAVEEDNNPLATGHLDATDVDHNAGITWSVVGGQQANSDAIFALDEFKIIKGSNVLFDDTFSDGIAPPNAPNFTNGTTTSYATPTGTTFVETLDHVIMYGPLGPAPSPGIGPGAPNFVTESATLLTNNDPAQGTSGLGLRIGTTFSVEGRFEGIVPEDAREGYGIRLTDRNTPAAPTTSNPFNAGNDVLELTVRRDANGNLAIQFRDLDIENNTTPVLLGSVAMTPAMIDGNQIVLQLNHATAGSQSITASFSIVDHDGNVIQPMTVIQNLANTGPAVGQAFNGELYTRAQFIGFEPVENVSYLHGQYGSLTIDQSGNWKYLLDNNSASVQALAEGETVTDTFTVRATDEHGAFDSKTINVTVTGDNDAPKITSAVTTGSVQEDSVLQATGTLTATDVDHNAIKTWNVTSVNTGNTGNAGHTTDYKVTIDEFKIVKNGVTIFDDTFTGTFPPTAPAGGPGYFGAINQFTGADGRAVMDDEHSGIGFSISNPALDFTGQPTGGIGNWAQIGTNNDPANLTQGLKSGSSFSISGTYDLIHSEAGYGIRLANTDGSINFAGNDVVDFNVRTGGPFGPSALYLQLTQIDFTVPNGATTLQQLQLSPPAGADQILLTLTHDAAPNGVVKASFSYLDNGTVVSTGTLSAEGHIFQHTNWVRGGFEATAPGNTSSFVNGLYGALAINQSGNWTYQLANNQANVQALAQGETVTDTFTVKVTDEHGAFDTRTINVTVTGTNDVPTVSAAVTGTAEEGSGTQVVDLLQLASDVDHGAVLHVENVTWDAVPGSTPGDIAFVGNTLQIDTNGLAFDGLNQGESVSFNFTYNVVDEHGASTVQHATVTITGTSDGPTVSAAVTGGGDEGTGPATVDLLQFASSPDALHVENVIWDEVPGTMPAGFTLAGNTFQVDTDALAYSGLAAGETFVTHFTYNVVDEHGGSTPQHATVTITGTNDAPFFVVTPTPALLGAPALNNVGNNPLAVAAGDFNGDGKQDLAVSNTSWSSNSISVLLGNGDGTFQPQTAYGVGAGPRGVAIGDFNGDGKLDLVSANTVSSNVSVLLGNGDGTFAAQAAYATQPTPTSVAVGDVNGDGKLDLVVSEQENSNTTSVLLGNGDGTFQSGVTYATNPAPTYAALGDLNGDGSLDIVTANGGSSQLSILFNNGDGSFQSEVPVEAGLGQNSVAISDLNGDGKADLAVVSVYGATTGDFSPKVSILLGHGDGTFDPAVAYGTGTLPAFVAVADMNGDGKKDLVVADSNDDTVSILLGNGDGTFQPRTAFASGHSPELFALGDFNGDGRPDVAVSNYSGDSRVAVLLNQGSPGPSVTEDATPGGVDTVSGTLNFGDPDLSDHHTVGSAPIGGGYIGTFSANVSNDATGDGAGTVSWNFSASDADLNSLARGETRVQSYNVTVDDGHGGIDTEVVSVTLNGANDAPTVSHGATDVVNEGSGTHAVDLLQFASDVDNGAVLHIENVSWDEGPGLPAGFTIVGNTIQVDTNSPTYDAMMMSETYTTHFTYNVVDEFGASVVQHATVTVLGTNDAPTVSAAVTGSGTEGTGIQSVNLLQFASDVDHDASLNISNVVWDEGAGLPAGFSLVGNTLQFDTNAAAYDGLNTGESYTTHFTYDVVDSHGASVQQHATVTINGVTDIVNPNQAPVINFTTGTGFAPTANFNAGARPGHAAIGDVNGDGKADLVVSNFHGQSTVSVLLGDGNGNFGAPVSFSTGGGSPGSVALADFNNDGKLDVATTNQDTANVAVLLGNGAGSFGAPTLLSAGNPTSVTTGDFNHDGYADLLVGQSVGNRVSLFLNNGNGTFATPTTPFTGLQVLQTAVGDFNHDGNLDFVAAANSGTGTPRAVVELGNGNGTFGAPTTYFSTNLGAGVSAASIAVGDFNGDGNLDIAQADTGTPGVSIMLGTGTGTFGARTSYGTIMPANSTHDLVVGDFNGDGKQDLALGNTANSSASVMYGNGDGSFQPQVSFATGTEPSTITAGDVNGDGRTDLITPNNLSSPGTVSVLKNLAGTPVNEDSSLTLTNISVTDPDAGSDNLSVSLAVAHGQLSLATTNGLSGDLNGSDGVMSFTGSQAAINAALASGLTYAPALNYNGGDDLNIVVNDQGHNGTGGALSDSETIHLTVNPVNDAPTIAGVGPSTGSVTEDNTRQLTARGNLFASDLDGDQTTWSIVGGTTSASTQDFRFQVDNLKITKNGGAFFEDAFNDGNAVPNFANGTAASYTVNGTVTEAAGRVFFDGTQATTFGATNYGERMTLNTNNQPVATNNGGLKYNADFTAEARFDLITPEDAGDVYGVRLVDPATAGNNNSVVDLVVLRDATGVHVAMRQINPTAGTNVVLQQIDLPSGFDQIVFKLNYLASSYVNGAGGKITASADLLVGGVATQTLSFAPQGTIFDGEEFTQVQLVGQANQAETGVYKMGGIYGTLTMAQDGQWHYFLADQQANVQALDAGVQMFDNFTVRVSDGHGGFADRQVQIAVNGASDGNASIGNPSVNSVTEDFNVSAGNLTASGTITVSDPDAGQSSFQTSVTPNVGTLGSLTLQPDGNYTYSVANSAVQFLGANATKVDNFTVRSTDGTSKVVSFTINGVNDAPVANPDVNTGAPVVELGTPVFGNAWANGGVLQNDTDVDNGDVRSVAGVTAGATNSALNSNVGVEIAGTYGSLTMNASGGWGYHLDDSKPATNALVAGQVVQDVFTYTVSDGHGGTANTTLSINVTGSNDAPTASLPKHEILEGSGVHQFDLLAGSSDPEGNTVHVGSISEPWEFLTLNADGHTISVDTGSGWFDYMAMGQTADFNFTYELVDSYGASSTQWATLRMVGTDDTPLTVVDGNWTVHASGGNDPGHPEATMRLFVADPDWVGFGPNNEPIHQSVYADTTGWTANGGGIFSKTGTYGTLVWNTNFVTTPDGQHYATLTYQIDNNDVDTLNLDSSDNVYDSFAVTYTDGTLSTTRIANYEVVGRDDMYGSILHWQVYSPTTDIPSAGDANAMFTVGPQVELTGYSDADVDLTRDKIIINWHDPASYPLGGNYRWSDGSVHNNPPPPGESYTIYSGVPFNGFKVSGLPDTLINIALDPGSYNSPPVSWPNNVMMVDNQGLSYPGGAQQVWTLTFSGGTAEGNPAMNPNPGFVDVGATSQSIGPTITVHDSFIFDLNVPYNGNVQFEGAAGTLKFENTAFTGTVSNFQAGDHLDFSAITGGNATVHQELDGTLEAHSIGWTNVGADTFVFVNNTGVDEAIAAADMMVKLLGVTQLHNHDVIV